MDQHRLDSISKLFASRRSRRSAIVGGLAAAAGGKSVFARDATPEVATPVVDPNDPHPSADDAHVNPEFLFVQPFDGGTWAPKAGEAGVYTLTLTGAAAHTVYFSDRPERIVGLSPTQQFLDGLGFTPENPPNAAIVAPRDDGSAGQEILVIELRNPVYDADAETLTYDAIVLADYGEHGLAHLANQQQDYELGETFGAGGLFIDDCQSQPWRCLGADNVTTIGTLQLSYCWDDGECQPCTFPPTACDDAFPDKCPANGCGAAWGA